MKNGGIIVSIIGAFFLAFSIQPLWLCFAIMVIGLAFCWHSDPRPDLLVRIVALAVVAWVVGEWNRTHVIQQTDGIKGQAGQYRASSPDLLGLVKVRVVSRVSSKMPPILIFAEAHAVPFFGVDEETLKREVKRALEHQGVPKEIDPNSDPMTALLVKSALATAISGTMPREEPTLPEGAWSDGKGANSYWGMFPDEYSHNCELIGRKDGRYEGTSSNPNFRARVALTLNESKIQKVEVLDIRTSTHGRQAVIDIPKKMVEEQRIDVDIVSGATRTSYILRSAAYNACMKAASTETQP